MRRDLTIKTGSLAGTSDFRVVAPIKKGFVPSLDAMTYKTRVKRVLRTLHIGRSGGFEYELARVLSDAVQRVGKIHSVSIAVLEPEDKVLLTVTFDGAWEAYVRVIWQKVARLLDLVFCNTEGYVLGYENTYEKWGAWLKQAQTEASFLYATPGLTVDDTRYLQMEERVYRRKGGDCAEQLVTQIRIPTAEEIALQSIFDNDTVIGIDPTNAGFGQPLSIEEAGRPPFRHGVRSVVGLYRLADVYPPHTDDGRILHRAAHELLPEFVKMLQDGTTYKLGIDRASKRFEEAMRWIQARPVDPDVRTDLPLCPPKEPPLQDPGNIQGGIVHAYPDVDQGCLLLLQFTSPAALSAFLKVLQITSEADPLQPEQIATNIAFTVEGLRAAGLSDDEVRSLPEEFVQGMERRAGLLGDLRINHPRRWRLPALNWHLGAEAPDIGEKDPAPRIDLSALHAVAQFRMQTDGSDPAGSRAKLMATMEGLVAAHSGVKPLSLQWMQRRRNAADQFEEHFGFVDSNSDPVLSSNNAGVRFHNHIHLGEILCGYPNLADKTSPYDNAPEQIRSLLQDGSFLALRKLRQDIATLEKALSEAGTAAAVPPPTREELMAKMMGRWPGNHVNAGEPLADGVVPHSNDFNFNNDPHGMLCPFHAHIRRANPRITDPEPGSRPARIVRRGMSYGPQHDRNADAQALQKSLDQERGLIFMTYNASLGEQFEVVQRWLSGGNSSASYSGQSDAFIGLAEPGRRRYFRFERETQTIRMALDGSDRLHDEPQPFVRLEWGAYLFAPSRKALATLQQRAAAQGDRQAVTWSAEVGENEIVDLRKVEINLGEMAAIDAWKSALEDPDAAADFTTASIWAAIRERHGGVLRTPYGILVADREMVEQVFSDPQRNLSITGYLPRMRRSFGVLYLGLDPDQEDHAYERESEACNRAIMALDQYLSFKQARDSTQLALQKLVDEAIGYARDDGESRWELTLDVRELLEPLLADFCEKWFGLDTKGGYFSRGGYRWDWVEGNPPYYPGHFLSPSRYIFQPHPGTEVEKMGAAHGVAVRRAMIDFLKQYGATITAPVTRAVLDSPLGQADPAFVARAIAGAMMGFIPTVEGNLRRILNEWLNEGTLWKLRARYSGTEAADFTEACNRLGDDFIPAMQLRAVPELIWRTATVSHTLGECPHQVDVKPGEIVVAGAISATQQNLQDGRRDFYHAFGGNRRDAGHPTHACPGANPAVAVMLGFFSALVESPLPLRAGPGPLTLAADGRLPHPAIPALKEAPLVAFQDVGNSLLKQQLAVSFKDSHAFEIKAANLLLGSTKTQLAAIGDSWLYNNVLWYCLVSPLDKRGYKLKSFASTGRRLAEMASPTLLNQVKSYLANAGANSPKALLIGGGGNDVYYEAPSTTNPPGPPKPSPLYDMLVDAPQPGQDPLIEDKIKRFIDVDLFGYYTTIVDTLKVATPVPILIHAYDHPIPDGRGILGKSGPWLQPVFAQRHIDISTPDGLKLGTDVMRVLINRLNKMVATVATANPGRVYHVDLTGTLAKDYGDIANYKLDWENELHPTARHLFDPPGVRTPGFDLLAGVIADKLKDLGILPPP
jgi:deferrochelatase/peroxidase EfeB